ncbi:hypothetical protein AKG98_3404 [Moritella sp. JT01]|nr:hypothetical protein AKG98_3404 [Moritella sp. JT01]
MIVSPSEKLSFGVESFDDGFAELGFVVIVELSPPREKLSFGVVSFGDEGFGVDSFRGLSTGEESVEDGVFEEDIIAPIAVIIEGLNVGDKH